MSQWIFIMSSRGSNAGMETSAPLINIIINNALIHSNSHINQIPLKIIHILCFFLVDSLSDFVIKYMEVRAVCCQKSGSSNGSLTLLNFRTESSK